MLQEKRRADRCAMDDEVRVVLAKGLPIHAQTMDISESGLRIRLDEKLEIGATVKIILDFLKTDLPTSTLEVDAQVMHRFTEPGGDFYQVGLKLTYSSEVQERNILTHLTTCRTTF